MKKQVYFHVTNQTEKALLEYINILLTYIPNKYTELTVKSSNKICIVKVT